MEERRRTQRAPSRMLCRLRSGIQAHSGIVLDVSTGGVFVQTTARFLPGTELALTIHVPGGRAFSLEGQVARVVEAPIGLEAEAGCGLALVLTEASDAYVAWVGSLGDGAGAPRERSFRVRVAEIAGEGARDVYVRCGSEAEASELALAEFDGDWKVLGVEAE